MFGHFFALDKLKLSRHYLANLAGTFVFMRSPPSLINLQFYAYFIYVITSIVRGGANLWFFNKFTYETYNNK